MLPSVVTWHIRPTVGADYSDVSVYDGEGSVVPEEVDPDTACLQDIAVFELESTDMFSQDIKEFRDGTYYKFDKALVVNSTDHRTERDVLVSQHEQVLGHISNRMKMDSERAQARLDNALKSRASRKLTYCKTEDNDSMSQCSTPRKGAVRKDAKPSDQGLLSAHGLGDVKVKRSWLTRFSLFLIGIVWTVILLSVLHAQISAKGKPRRVLALVY